MQTTVPLFAREASLDAIKPEILDRVRLIVEGNAYIQGEDVAAFEREFADYLGREHCVGVANGTDALMIGLLALGVKPGDEVVVPAVTFFATAEAVAAIGARPVFADIELDTWTVSARTIEPVLTKATSAIVPVHLFGNPAPMKEIGDLADSHGLPVLEDAAQAAGASYSGKMCGAIGDAAAFSFYPGKNLGAIGDAGACRDRRSRGRTTGAATARARIGRPQDPYRSRLQLETRHHPGRGVESCALAPG